MKRLLTIALVLAAMTGTAVAQQGGAPVQAFPIPRVITNSSTTVAVTNTFQQVMAANTNRLNCVIQNTGTNPMYVFFGATASATIAASIKLIAGQTAYCESGGITYQGAVQITGTATETFYASFS